MVVIQGKNLSAHGRMYAAAPGFGALRLNPGYDVRHGRCSPG
jgi:hypothetical protein